MTAPAELPAERNEQPGTAPGPSRSWDRGERLVRGVQQQPERDADDRRVVGFGSDLPALHASPRARTHLSSPPSNDIWTGACRHRTTLQPA